MSEKKPPVLRDWFWELGQGPDASDSGTLFGMIESIAKLSRLDAHESVRRAWLLAILVREVNDYAKSTGVDLRSALATYIDAGKGDPEADYLEAVDNGQLDVRAVPAPEVKPEPEVEPMPRYRVVSTNSRNKLGGVLRELAAEGYLLHSFVTESDGSYTAVLESKET